MKRRLVTSALPYVNNVPHLGNLIQVLSADVFSRFCRLRGYDTLYVCGTDEYGTATETKAAEEGISPRELCDRYHALHAGIYQWFGIAFDKFGRTSTPIQTEIVQDIFKKLDAAGYIVERTIEQLYCHSCARFLADRYVRGTCPHCGYADARGDQCEACGKLLDPTELKDPRCSSCGATPTAKSTKHLYIDLPKIRPRLEAWIKDASVRGFWANNAIQMTQAWVRDGLRERAITRDLKWGIPVPKAGYEDKVFYVWFDAPIGYVSIAANRAADEGKDWKAFMESWWKSPEDVELFQFIGKDNIPFHTVIFPSSLLGTGEKWTLLHHMSSTEYLNYESGKFSKSKGVGVFGTDVMESGIPADVWRFYVFYNRPEKADALFTWKDFQEKVNGELIGNLGNLVNRTLSFVSRYYDGKIPAVSSRSARSQEFWKRVGEAEAGIGEKLERAELRDAFRAAFELSSYANKAFQDGAPWKTRTEKPEDAAELIRDLCYVLRDLAVIVHPYIPRSAERIAGFFGQTIASAAGTTGLSWKDLGRQDGLSSVNTPEVLFSKLEDDLVNQLRERYSGSQKERAERDMNEEKAKETKTAADKPTVAPAPEAEAPKLRDEVRFAASIDLRVARIVKIDRHPKADKLYIENLEIAGEERTIVSGLVPYYKEEELLDKKILVAYNLKPAKLRGVESRGMLLAASAKGADDADVVDVLFVPDPIPTGTRVIAAGNAPAECAEIDIDSFFSIPIRMTGGIATVGGVPLTVGGETLKSAKVSDGEVG
jgi:methionyl-tRNA synthetase